MEPEFPEGKGSVCVCVCVRACVRACVRVRVWGGRGVGGVVVKSKNPPCQWYGYFLEQCN